MLRSALVGVPLAMLLAASGFAGDPPQPLRVFLAEPLGPLAATDHAPPPTGDPSATPKGR